MQLFAQVTNDGTAMSETVLCSVHFASHKPHFETDHDYEGGAAKDGPRFELADKTWHDVTGNDAVSCNVCGVDGLTPDLIGKTVKNINYTAGEPEVEYPATTLQFTDGTSHTFIHPHD